MIHTYPLVFPSFPFQNNDRDKFARRLAPVALSADGWTDILNEQMVRHDPTHDDGSTHDTTDGFCGATW